MSDELHNDVGDDAMAAAHREVGEVDLGPVTDREVANARVRAEVIIHASQEGAVVRPGNQPRPRHYELHSKCQQ